MRVEQKARIFLMVCAACFFAGCGSTKVENSPYLIEYEEMPIKEFKNKRNDIWNSEKLKYYDRYKKQEKYSSVLFSDFYSDGRKGYKLTDVFIEWKEYENTLILKIDDSNSVGDFDCADYLFNIASGLGSEEFEFWKERFKAAIYNKKYNGHFTVYVYCKIGREFVHDIEGIPTAEQLSADKAAKEEAERKSEESAKKFVAENHRKVDERAIKIAKGYIYHGYDEEEKNRALFRGNALENGHAYLIAGCNPSSSGNYVELGSKDVWVEYANNKVKQAALLAKYSIAVVVTKGRYEPLILGIVGEYRWPGYIINDYSLYPEYYYQSYSGWLPAGKIWNISE